jgi:predicted amidophosphoribosyltransferase
MEIITLVGRYLSDVFFEPADIPTVQDVHIVEMSHCFRSDFEPETIPEMFVAGPYDSDFAAKLRAFKYHADPKHLDEFARTLRTLLLDLSFDLIALPPTPLSRRIARLGRMPMVDIARAAGYTDRLMSGISCSRTFLTGQARKDRAARMRLLAGDVFSVDGSSSLSGKRVVIADDVLSTGATAHALARALR